jgi:proton glutamate symport protein
MYPVFRVYAMPKTIATPQHGGTKFLVILSLAGAALWLVGTASSLLNQATPGAALRATALVLLGVVGLRKPSLIFWTFLAMIAGVELGFDAPQIAVNAHFLGDLFLRLIRMIVAPLLFASITAGIAGHGRLRSIGRVAIKALIYFEIVTTLGLLIGALAMNISGAGWGVMLSAAQGAEVAVQSVQTWQQNLVNLFPENLAQAVSQNQILQVAIFSLLFGAALALLPEQKRKPLVPALQSVADTMFQLTRLVMFLAPLAAGSALAYTVASMGLAMLIPLVKVVLTFYVALFAFCLVVMLPILIGFRIPLRGFIAAVAEPAAIGFATTTSEAALPLAIERMEEFGVPRWIASFVIPTGYSFNMTGSSVYLSMAAVFTAQAAGFHMSSFQFIAMLATLMLASKGVAGVPRAVLVVLLATANSTHLPTAPILLFLGVDTLMDMGRTTMNVVGNCMASVVVARAEGSFEDSSEPARS